jgi:hypothetical protein
MAKAQIQRRFSQSFLWGITTVLLLLVATLLIVLTSISESSSLVEETASVDTTSVIKAKKAAKQVYKDLMDGKQDELFTLILSENEINGIVAIGSRAVPEFKGHVHITPQAISGFFTLNIASNPLGKYVNLKTIITPSSNGLSIKQVSIGSINIPGNLAVLLVEFVLNRAIADDVFGTRLLNAINSIEVNKSSIILTYSSVPGLRNAIESTKDRYKALRDDLALLSDPALVRIYYQHICNFNSSNYGIGQESVGHYLDAAFTFAKKRSGVSKAPVEENKAALLALAIYLGSYRFDTVIGALDKETLAKCQPQDRKILLANRSDLRLHFIFSAALKIISDSEISFVIGEFKELLDTQRGGSGFSFADLAADRAGIRFAELALDKKGSLRVQKIAPQLRQEERFFPSIIDLPEGIPQSLFDKHGGIESEYYKKHLTEIDKRINAIELYQVN